MTLKPINPFRYILVLAAFAAGACALTLAFLFDHPFFAFVDLHFQAFLDGLGVYVAARAYILALLSGVAAGALWLTAGKPSGVLRKAIIACALIWGLAAAVFFYDARIYELKRADVLETGRETATILGAHFITGYADARDVEPLAARGLIAGVYLARHNVLHRSVAQVRAEVDHLQALRAKAGLPPLIVAVDQEGGAVSHMTPPAPRRSSLADLESSPQAQDKARQLGVAIGQDLAELGVNLNFAPVVDLRAPESEAFSQNHKDLSQIARRAVSSDPARTIALAAAFIDGQSQVSILSTIKHFPGLGRVSGDTHMGPATLNASRAMLDAQELAPFRALMHKPGVFLMASHASAPAIDPQWPISQSSLAISELARKEFGFQGPIVTDDFVMGAVFNDGCAGIVRSLNAGVDLLLISYDGRQFYRLFQCARNAHAQGAVKSSALSESQTRLHLLNEAAFGARPSHAPF